MVSTTRIKKITAGLDDKLKELQFFLAGQIQLFYKTKILPRADIVPLEMFRAQYETQIRDKIQSAVESAYRVGTELVAREIRTQDPEFTLKTSKTDFNAIMQKTIELNDDFWRTVGRLLQRHNEFVQIEKDAELVRKRQFAIDAYMTGLASFVVYKAFNTAVVNKTQVVDTPAVNKPAPVSKTRSLIQADGSTALETTLIMRELSGDLIYLTAEDEKVCTPATNRRTPCEPLNRTVYGSHEPGIPQLPRHRYCACKLIPIVGMSFSEVRSLTNPRGS